MKGSASVLHHPQVDFTQVLACERFADHSRLVADANEFRLWLPAPESTTWVSNLPLPVILTLKNQALWEKNRPPPQAQNGS